MANWDQLGTSGDVDDRRGKASLIAGGGILGLIITGAIMYLSGQSGQQILLTLLQQGLSDQTISTQVSSSDNSEYSKFASTVLGSTNQYWTKYYTSKQLGTYKDPTLVLFKNGTSTGCGYASSSTGPFYCPADQTIYLDESFFDEIKQSLNANTGDVAQAYVIAHEVGHHVQNLDGQLSSEANSVDTELQADCYAGVWAHSIQGIFDSPNEINEALDLASAIGDDAIQEKTEGHVNKETWTHGSSTDRQKWFKTGYESGDPLACRP